MKASYGCVNVSHHGVVAIGGVPLCSGQHLRQDASPLHVPAKGVFVSITRRACTPH